MKVRDSASTTVVAPPAENLSVRSHSSGGEASLGRQAPSGYLSQQFAENSLLHALAAGFGYALVLRTEFMNITIGQKELALGPDLIYTGLMNYINSHLDCKIQRERDAVRRRLLDRFTDLQVYEGALNVKISDAADAGEREELVVARDRILNDTQTSDLEKIYGLARILIQVEPDEEALTGFLEEIESRAG